MKMSSPMFGLLAISFGLAIINIACEKEIEKHSRLTQKLATLQQRQEAAKQKLRSLQEEQKKSIQASTKERYAFLSAVVKNQWLSLPSAKYLSEMQIQGPIINKTLHEYWVNLRFIVSDLTPQPKFTIYVYNSKGLLIGSCQENKGKITQTEKQYKMVLDAPEEPIYFRIEFWD